MHVKIESRKKIESMSNASRIRKTVPKLGGPFSNFGHLDRNERLDLNVRVGMTADVCSGPLSRTPLRLASSVFYRPWVSGPKVLQKTELGTGHMRPTRNL